MRIPDYYVRVIDLPPAVRGVTLPNDDGSFSGMYEIKNGTDELQHIKSVSIEITDSELGTVIDISVPLNRMIDPGKAEKFYFTVSAENVTTDPTTWGNLTSHINVVY